MKGLSIPRLELLSARILAVLMNTVYNALKTQIKIDCIRYWLDSMTALYWIFNNGEWKQWVQYRVSEILKLTNKENWGHVEGTNNPADIGSEGFQPVTCVIASCGGMDLVGSKRGEVSGLEA